MTIKRNIDFIAELQAKLSDAEEHIDGLCADLVDAQATVDRRRELLVRAKTLLIHITPPPSDLLQEIEKEFRRCV